MTTLTLPHTNAAIWGLEEMNISTAIEYRWMESTKGAKWEAKRRSLRFFPFVSISFVISRILSALGGVLESPANSSGVRIR